MRSKMLMALLLTAVIAVMPWTVAARPMVGEIGVPVSYGHRNGSGTYTSRDGLVTTVGHCDIKFGARNVVLVDLTLAEMKSGRLTIPWGAACWSREQSPTEVARQATASLVEKKVITRDEQAQLIDGIVFARGHDDKPCLDIANRPVELSLVKKIGGYIGDDYRCLGDDLSA